MSMNAMWLNENSWHIKRKHPEIHKRINRQPSVLKQLELGYISFYALIFNNCFDLSQASSATGTCCCEQLHIGQIVAVVFSNNGAYFFFGDLIALTDHFFLYKYMNNDNSNVSKLTLMWK